MREATLGNTSAVAGRTESTRRNRFARRCSICTKRAWYAGVRILEPEGVPEPRLNWTLCKRCNLALQEELKKSPVQSPLRTRIAMGMVASMYWPSAYPTRLKAYISDRRWFVFIAAGFVVAMLAHLVLMVLVAGIQP